MNFNHHLITSQYETKLFRKEGLLASCSISCSGFIQDHSSLANMVDLERDVSIQLVVAVLHTGINYRNVGLCTVVHNQKRFQGYSCIHFSFLIYSVDEIYSYIVYLDIQNIKKMFWEPACNNWRETIKFQKDGQNFYTQIHI